ncbi:alpha/beta fold hydrolase [Psychrobacillus sp.]|uniref:alpha/beta fold hydrolase n=1 Tax=Psychrobacillus sp. TaxID=1871623 RepID=UPI0028BDB386|nr:alpha/beta fold hydrolase [Psychrobacillus sp.]
MKDYELFELGDVSLQSGDILPNAILAYKTFGKLNEDKNNVIVYPTWFAGMHTDNEWLIGNGKALDPEKYFIIVPNMLGNGLSSSPSNTLPPYHQSHFPHISIYDNVRLQHQLVTKKFGITKIALVVGWSLGAVQTFQWGASYPDMVERIAPFGGTAKTRPHAKVVFEGMIAALKADAGWKGGYYKEQPTAGLAAMGRVYAAWGFSQAYYLEQLYQQEGFANLEEYLVDYWDQVFLSFDANNLISMLRTGITGDISANTVYNGNFELALSKITARAMVMPGSTDLFFPPQDNEYETRHMPNATFLPIESNWGHCAGIGQRKQDSECIDERLKQFLLE